jgi:hypothetical protein
MIKVKDTPEKSHEILPLVLSTFKEAKINPNPINYLVWYQY